MATIEKAVILAAGAGSRLLPISGTVPKPLLSLDGRPGSPCFLDWHVGCLSAMGVEEIHIVGNRRTFGWRSEHADYGRVRWVLNPSEEEAQSGSGHSLWLAAMAGTGLLDGGSRLLMMDADIIYDPRLLTILADAPGPRSKILVCGQFDDTSEEVLVFAKDGEPRLQGKGLLGTRLVDGLECLGEATGMVLFEPDDHPLLATAASWVMRFATARERSEHEDIVQPLLALQRLAAVTFSDLAFFEVDTPGEYARLVRDVYPAVTGSVACG